MEPRSIARAHIRIRPTPEPGLGIIGYIMPFFGLELVDMARDVTALNLPARGGHLIGVSL